MELDLAEYRRVDELFRRHHVGDIDKIVRKLE
jgi:hypothetical protein